MATSSMRLPTPNEAMRDFLRATRKDKARFAAGSFVIGALALANILITYFWWLQR